MIREMAGDEAGFGLYIHWPFCRTKCPYCDFNSHVAGVIDQEAWADALQSELDHIADALGKRRLHSIFFGGGTPSLMAPTTAGRLIDRAIERFSPESALEVTLEANPTSVERDRLAAFKTAGVNRVSLGVQSLEAEALRFLGRDHNAEEALAAVDMAARLFERFSFDLIYARPGQTLEGWADELNRALDHAGGHLSVYQLTIEPGTRFHHLHRQGALRLPEDDLQADMFEFTQSRLEEAGLPAYEISNHAAPGQACRHNLIYWRTRDYAGIGPGAHGRLTIDGQRFATQTERMPRAWLDRVTKSGHGTLPHEPLDRESCLIEMMLMGLRMTEGIDVQRLERASGTALAETLDGDALKDFVNQDWLKLDERRLAATTSGRLRLNALLSALLAPLTSADLGTNEAATCSSAMSKLPASSSP